MDKVQGFTELFINFHISLNKVEQVFFLKIFIDFVTFKGEKTLGQMVFSEIS